MQPLIFVSNLIVVNDSTAKICKNCGFHLETTHHFCPNCGQEHKERVIYFKEFFIDFLGDYFTFDSKIIRSVKPLLFNPGFLTREYLDGRRVRYIPPLRMYIFISIFFFLMLSSSKEPIQLDGENLDAAFFDAYFDIWMPRLFFFLLPLFAFFTYFLFRQRGRYYLSSFIFSVHFHAFVLLLFTVYIFITSYFSQAMYGVNQWMLLACGLIVEIYLLMALKRVFDKKWFSTWLRLIFLNVLYIVSVAVIFLAIAVLIYKTQY